ncbi:hypothetical protein FRC00_010857, partial [Tulasnella sp. 408]
MVQQSPDVLKARYMLGTLLARFSTTTATPYRLPPRPTVVTILIRILMNKVLAFKRLFNTLGSNFVTIALQAARAADSNAKLYIEEYGAESVNVKSNALGLLVTQLKINAMPLDGLGFEAQVGA